MYNTINLTGQALKSAWARTTDQKSIVLGYFHLHPEASLGPSTLLEKLVICGRIDDNTPITSIRRAMTDLTTEGYLTKTDVKQRGLYGDSEHLWVLKEKQGRLF